MEVTLKKFGNSVGFVIPKTVREASGLNEGTRVEVDLTPNGFSVRSTKPKYSLNDLLSQCDFSTPLRDEEKEFLNRKPVGNEQW